MDLPRYKIEDVDKEYYKQVDLEELIEEVKVLKNSEVRKNLMKYKLCAKCNINRTYPEFYRHPVSSDGYQNICKDCMKKDAKKRRLKRNN